MPDASVRHVAWVSIMLITGKKENKVFNDDNVFSATYSSDPMSCNANCHCSTKNYKPMCGPDGVTNYFSPCFAGCTSYDSANKVFFVYLCILTCYQKYMFFF